MSEGRPEKERAKTDEVSKRTQPERKDASEKIVQSGGESLEEFTDQEWETGATAMPAELLNVEKKPNIVNVFVGPRERGETFTQHPAKKPQNESSTDKKDPIQQLVRHILQIICAKRVESQTEVDVFLKVRDDPKRAINLEESAFSE
ncbi:hypothetical protein RB195_011005 [Necator americanus]